MNLSVFKYSLSTLFFFLLACDTSRQKNYVKYKTNESYNQANESMIQKIQSGDVILRQGKDELSQLFARLNKRHQQYSHCGIALQTDSGTFVYHIISTAQNIEGKILCEPVSTFIQPRTNAAWAIVRYDLNVNQVSDLLYQISGYAAKGVVFDKQFDLATNDKLYCSEMLYKAILLAKQDSTIIKPTTSNTGKIYIAIDNLYEHKHCKTIGEIAY